MWMRVFMYVTPYSMSSSFCMSVRFHKFHDTLNAHTQAKDFGDKLLGWYDANKRDLPWRHAANFQTHAVSLEYPVCVCACACVCVCVCLCVLLLLLLFMCWYDANKRDLPWRHAANFQTHAVSLENPVCVCVCVLLLFMCWYDANKRDLPWRHAANFHTRAVSLQCVCACVRVCVCACVRVCVFICFYMQQARFSMAACGTFPHTCGKPSVRVCMCVCVCVFICFYMQQARCSMAACGKFPHTCGKP